MKPKSYNGKGEGKKPFPFFDSRELAKEGDCCHILFVSDSTIRIMIMLSAFLDWPTRWDDSNQEEDIDEIVRRFKIEMIPCDNVISDLTQVLKLMLDRMNNQTGENNMSNCGCCGSGSSGGNGGTFDPTTWPNVPENPSEIQTVVDVDCKFANYTYDKIVALLDDLSTRLGWGVVGLTAFGIASIMAGQIEITGALVTFMWGLFTQGMLTAAGVASVSNFFTSRKDSFLCYVSTHSNSSPASFKAACLAWLHSQGDDNTPQLTILIGLFTLGRWYNKLLQDGWKVGYEDVTCCGDEPEVPSGAYSLENCINISTGDILDLEGNVITSVTVSLEGNTVAINGTLERGKGFKVPLACMSNSSHYVVGWAVRCTNLIKSITQAPTNTFIRDTPSTVTDYGVIRLGEGFCGISDSENGEEFDLFVAYLESVGIDVFPNLDSEVLDTINSLDYFTCASYEKESVGGTGGNVDLEFKLYYVRRV